ncbi:hypothetical protein LEP1GSC044_2225 [Leptospira kirschneri serovar Grippotyphosa str. RM52]|nr:hypothetical protein LEP1GSC044_2225 [Leptospira kirschneri serovar Grippotyphosa str. RM52]EMK00148.1 hypothetical protein LEP1GSC176_0614 [Leptospira kirschneri str. MMD1493]EMK16385.1 hypothetical protein LEP1GSC042_1085 [Leptospira kirschneri serovar Bim str. PUO 1247]EMN04208.1 hypothetical protein LEP1GSC046_3826 [Leptospira kirschneri serovar Bim str. 1051]EMO79780.1 hypothetical protein LEP1GSC126_0726 [Leptospira kirschneri str. 200801774]
MEKLIKFKELLENNGNLEIENSDRVVLLKSKELYHLEFYGNPAEDNYYKLLEIICDKEISEKLKSIDFKGPDKGANGTRNWDLNALVNGSAFFKNLEYFAIEKTKSDHHNRTIIGESYQEDGVLAKLVIKCPKLRVLISPSAPNSDFFRNQHNTLELLNVSAGYAHENFIENLSIYNCFPMLTNLQFGEYNETYMNNYLDLTTPFDHYKKLFSSGILKNLRMFILENPVCSEEELSEIKTLLKDCQFRVIRWSSE